MTNMADKVAEKMEERRRELIAQPLRLIWPELARAAIEAMRPTNEQILSAVDAWLSEPEGFSLRAERLPTEMEVYWLRQAALVGASAAFPVDEDRANDHE